MVVEEWRGVVGVGKGRGQEKRERERDCAAARASSIVHHRGGFELATLLAFQCVAD